MSEEDEKRIETKVKAEIEAVMTRIARSILLSPIEERIQEAAIKTCLAECEYWRSKIKEFDEQYKKIYSQLKERDELLEEMHDLLLKSKEYLVKAGVLDTWRIDKIITRYSNLKAK